MMAARPWPPSPRIRAGDACRRAGARFDKLTLGRAVGHIAVGAWIASIAGGSDDGELLFLVLLICSVATLDVLSCTTREDVTWLDRTLATGWVSLVLWVPVMALGAAVEPWLRALTPTAAAIPQPGDVPGGESLILEGPTFGSPIWIKQLSPACGLGWIAAATVAAFLIHAVPSRAVRVGQLGMSLLWLTLCATWL